jgi:hypothetical protein
MNQYLVYGQSEKSIYIALKIFKSGRKVHLLFERNLLDNPINRFAFKLISFSYVDEISKLLLRDFQYLFLCDTPNDFSFVKEITKENPDLCIIDCLSTVTKTKYKNLEIHPSRIIKAFNNINIRNVAKPEISIRKETYFCCDNTKFISPIKNLGRELGYNCLYAGNYENENLIINLFKLQEELKKQEFPNNEINFMISTF